MAGVVIIGGGQGGFQVAASLRQEGFEEPVTLISEEPGLPYQRPPLSKAYIARKAEANSLNLRPSSFFDDQRIQLISGEQVTEIDRSARRIRLGSGSVIDYEHLVLAVGVRNRPLPMPGAELDGVLYLRTLVEAEALRQRLAPGIEIVVIGAGFIGLEFAAVANDLGASVTLVEMQQRVLARAVSPEMSCFYADAHTARGSRLIFGSSVERIVGRGAKVAGVQISGGRILPADLVLTCIGVVPNIELAARACLPVGDGIIVDEHLLTADKAISAIGDCALHPNQFASHPVRLESVQNAVDQARVVASRLAGRHSAYAAVPWFWSDQGPYKLQIAGLTAGADRHVIRGDQATGAFSVFCFASNRLLGVESVNRAADHVLARRLLLSGVPVSPEAAANPTIDLKSLASAAMAAHGGL